jgi:hypothetical protein
MKHRGLLKSVASLGIFCGCATCPAGPGGDEVVLVIVANGSWHNACAYEVQFQGTGSAAECTVSGLDCHCHGALTGDEVEVGLIGISPTGLRSDLDSALVSASASDCGDEPIRQVFERPPIEDFVRPGCPEAVEHLENCQFEGIVPFDECVDTTAEPGALAEVEHLSSYYACFTSSSCDTVSATFCQPGGEATGVSSLIECLATALELDGDQTAELADGAASTCPE